MNYSRELVDKEAMSNLAGIAQKLQDLDPETSAFQVATSERSQVAKFQSLQRITQSVSEIATQSTACKKGCSYCCYQSVSVCELEARAISKLTGRIYKKPEYTSVFKDRQMYRGDPCTFLSNGKCSIYAERPIICRTHVNMSCIAELCDVTGLDQDVPYLNMSSLTLSIGLICGVEFHDIRHWFPKE